MSRHFKNIHVGKSTVAVTGLGKSTVPAPLKIKIDPTNEEATTEIVQWGSDNLYPQNFYNKKFLKKNGAWWNQYFKIYPSRERFQVIQRRRRFFHWRNNCSQSNTFKYPEIKLFVRDNN
jgi:hypothetical protein